ncbi:MAG: hypothetical protein A3E87_01565 [Gammaproteobacteria bacterium RIFCSPHIGHO2_12_FULL_35_23]|nr:MAG: hypothetical protein A3E87_01565 [Gammaproteobacteria bacterium RIFCSPHIGHO2_12_FULL_35_23]
MKVEIIEAYLTDEDVEVMYVYNEENDTSCWISMNCEKNNSIKIALNRIGLQKYTFKNMVEMLAFISFKDQLLSPE